MSGPEFQRPHKDILNPKEDIVRADEKISIDGVFEPHFDYYKYTTELGKRTVGDNLPTSTKFKVVLALLLQDKQLLEGSAADSLGFGTGAIGYFIKRNGGREEFVKQFTSEEKLKETKADDIIVNLMKTMSARLSMIKNE
jgi:hypothetical protein